MLIPQDAGIAMPDALEELGRVAECCWCLWRRSARWRGQVARVGHGQASQELCQQRVNIIIVIIPHIVVIMASWSIIVYR